MRQGITRGLAALVGAAALSASGVAAADAAGAAAQPARAASAAAVHPMAVPGTELWVQRYNGTANRADEARSVAVAPDGSKVFVTGQINLGRVIHSDYGTVAYDAATGARLWVARYNGRANGSDDARSVAVSPDGSRVFVTGSSYGGTVTRTDYVTVAYRAADGKRLWAVRYNSGPHGYDGANSVAVNPSGATVFVTGSGYGVATGDGGVVGEDYVTVAYRASTGARLWVSRYDGPGNSRDFGDVVASPGNGRVYVTGSSTGSGPDVSYQYATVAYSAFTGKQLWAGRSAGKLDMVASLAVSPGRSSVFVTGSSWVGHGAADNYYTVAYNAVTGAVRWARSFDGGNSDAATAVAVSGSGARVFVTGSSFDGRATRSDFATVAYSAATGKRLWVARYNSGAGRTDEAHAMVTADGKVYVTGSSDAAGGDNLDYATVAYRASDGARLWVARYDGPAHFTDRTSSIAVSPRGTRVFVTGESWGSGRYPDYATVAYSG